jgi:hypothetical protein
MKQKAQKYKKPTFFLKSRDSLAGIATGYGMEDRYVGVRVPVGSKILSTSSRQALWSTQPLT